MQSPAATTRSDRRANVVWIIADQLRAQSLGYRGDPNVRTPNIDSLARRGMRFDAAVSGAPWCTPFRAALLTGTYPHQSGVTQTPSPLDPALPTVAGAFREAGYHTAWIGKWHLDGSNSSDHYVPRDRRGGFAFWRGYENNNAQHECYVYGGYTDPADPRYDQNDESPERLHDYETNALTDQFLSHLRSHRERDPHNGSTPGADAEPFFAVLSVQPPHGPYVGPATGAAGTTASAPLRPTDVVLRPNVPHGARARDQARLDIAGYCAMIENLDTNVGRLLEGLRAIDADRETWVVFFSDHGDMLGSHGQCEKSSPWEESIRIPLIVARIAGHQAMRTGVCDALVNHVDIGATSLGLCGIAVPDWVQGFDYSARCLPGSTPASATPASAAADRTAAAEPASAFLQQIPRKYHPHSVNRAWRGVVTRDGWKYVCTPGNDWLLFNLNEDPYEQANLCYDTIYQADKERCHAELRSWIERTGDSFDLPDVTLPPR
ncbi:MAG: hypothetical protein EA382_03380 [Spirochaetaceae bacterium]|nr:MAG: hypothetical protein EA382_03380 [Spirochaetaceae bacterium]